MEKGYDKGYTFEIAIKMPDYTVPALYEAKKIVDGRKVASVDPGARWYVWFNYKGKRYAFKNGINKLKTVKDRRRVGKAMVAAYTIMLERGWNPDTKQNETESAPVLTLENALKLALSHKKSRVKDSTYKGYEHRLTKFIEYTDSKLISGLPVDQFTKKQFAAFLNQIASEGAGKTSVRNYQRSISALFSKLVQDYHIKENPAAGIKTPKGKPEKNTPFTAEEFKNVVDWFTVNEPYMLIPLRLIVFALLRPIETVRLRVRDCNGDQLKVETKTDSYATIRIIDKLKPTIDTIIKQSTHSSDFIITKDFKPGPYNASAQGRYGFFQRRFKVMKDALGFDHRYGWYSLRHSAIFALYTSFIKDGLTPREAVLKMLPITRHRDEESLSSYLRDIGAFLPPDYGSRFKFDL
ncbi:site-specific integrase [Nonlabens agnitus]|uniref:Core-binding (CB) domain-containing protein n=1 Tax=Nonlabens agnitus TaxID=870484 RepID=A0A2S9WX90_9FLAO|nr:phage integrase N-terminal SAM-like domain-containing protein [Nonlabens agnitus]PRP68092.1 hypothetical protein BST86_13850 [Nonlabens agnitus]